MELLANDRGIQVVTGPSQDLGEQLGLSADADSLASSSEGYEIVSGPDLLELLNGELPDWIDADFLFPDFPPEEWVEQADDGPTD